jgi:hypothetical protein
MTAWMLFRLTALALMAAALAASAHAASTATLQVVRERPLVVSGARFKPNEAVRVTVRTPSRTLTRDMRASPRGGFTLAFRGVKFDFCAALSIVARGRSTGTVRAKLPQRACPSP